ncbi:MAG: hypothetical protein M3131_09355 [Actinomycetota bacterium]|nr:hypothetical protein [Actinomycetota bacterium]
MSAGQARLSPASLYGYERGSLLVPLQFLDLPSDLRLLGHHWRRKPELHVTAANTTSIAQRIRGPLALGAGAAEDAAWAALSDATRTRAVGDVVLSDEYRYVHRDADRTLIALCHVEMLDDLYRHLSERLGADIEPPPTHITLYTNPGGEGIGLHTRDELERDTSRLAAGDAAELHRAIDEATSR